MRKTKISSMENYYCTKNSSSKSPMNRMDRPGPGGFFIFCYNLFLFLKFLSKFMYFHLNLYISTCLHFSLSFQAALLGSLLSLPFPSNFLGLRPQEFIKSESNPFHPIIFAWFFTAHSLFSSTQSAVVGSHRKPRRALTFGLTKMKIARPRRFSSFFVMTN